MEGHCFLGDWRFIVTILLISLPILFAVFGIAFLIIRYFVQNIGKWGKAVSRD